MKAMLRATLLLIGLVCFATQTHAQDLGKKILGKWILQSMEIDISKVADMSDEIKAQLEMGNAAMKVESEKMKGKAFFEFLNNGQMNMYSEEKGEQKGTWKLEGDVVYLTKEDETDTEPFKVKVERGVLQLSIENPEVKGLVMVLKFTR